MWWIASYSALHIVRTQRTDQQNLLAVVGLAGFCLSLRCMAIYMKGIPCLGWVGLDIALRRVATYAGGLSFPCFLGAAHPWQKWHVCPQL